MRGVEAGEKMKFNLKNRPMFDEGIEYDRAEIIEWFEGFEKELRELMHDKKRYGRMYVEIKGILGE